MSERILLTGASGFTGKYLTSELRAAGHELFLLRSKNKRVKDTDGFAGDISCIDSMQELVKKANPTIVIHLAGESRPSSPNLAKMLELNILGAKNLLDALASQAEAPKRVILASSSNVYGPQKTNKLHEDLCPLPNTIYGCSKLSMELLSRAYSPFFQVLNVRPFNYTGIGQPDHFIIPKIISHFRDRRPTLRMGRLSTARDFSDVRDVAKIYTALVEAEISERFAIVNLTSGKVRSLEQIVEKCSEISGHNIDVSIDAEFLRPNDPETIMAATEKLVELIGNIPHRPLEETLAWMLAGE